MNSIQLAEVFKNVTNQVRLEMVHRKGKKRIKVEINLQDGSKRYYTARADSKKDALHEILMVIRCIEAETGQKILWREAGSETYHLGSKSIKEFSLINKLRKFWDMFWEIKE
ncbi:DUF6018 family natural product bioysynthesis protein [Anoxybacteroides tepidamans]|uniref:DUF6018 family natural product bioysynthesis protein n=1 Tax=Anoxybacteroides tepidamans TaxID=265948 RepID=UPI000488DF39|nr:DUF6018 family natural product bioysynthesis protein [Anoxybacillus tepidamans]